MLGKVAVQEDVDFGQEPLSGVRVKRDDGSVWEELIDEVRHMAHLACRNVPQHVRADVESAAMVGLMEAIRDFDEIEPGHFDQYVKSKVWGALEAEATRFDPESSRTGAVVRAANDNNVTRDSANPDLEPKSRVSATGERWSTPVSEAVMVPFSDETAHEDILTAETAFVGSYAATALRWGLAQLDKRERLVLRLAYKRGLALAAIAARLQVSTPRAYQIRVEAERKLAKLLRKSPALNQMPGARTRFDWDDHTDETLRTRTAAQGNASRLPKP